MEEKIIPEIEVKLGSITTLRVDAIVNPANSFGYMGGGLAEAIKKVGGQQIEDEAVEQAPIPVGEAILTNSGELLCSKVIHAPTMHNPGEKTDSDKVMCAVSSALELADKSGFRSLAIPGMGTGIGGLGKKESAETIIRAIKGESFHFLERIILIDIDEEMVKAFSQALKKKF